MINGDKGYIHPYFNFIKNRRGDGVPVLIKDTVDTIEHVFKDMIVSKLKVDSWYSATNNRDYDLYVCAAAMCGFNPRYLDTSKVCDDEERAFEIVEMLSALYRFGRYDFIDSLILLGMRQDNFILGFIDFLLRDVLQDMHSVHYSDSGLTSVKVKLKDNPKIWIENMKELARYMNDSKTKDIFYLET